MAESRFLVDKHGTLSPAEGDASSLAGRSGYYRLQATNPDWLLFIRQPQEGQPIGKPRVVMAGDCGSFPMQDLIAFMGQSRWSGVVKVRGTSGERTLLLKDGEVRGAVSDSVADRIGEVMVRLGYVTRPQLDAVLSEAPPSRIGRALVERGLLKSHDLYKCLQEQVSEIFHGMMLMKDGTFVLIDQDVDEKTQAHTLSMSMQGLLMDSIRKIDELAQFRKKIPHGGIFIVKKSASDGRLEPEEDQLLSLVDGQRTVLQLGQALKISEFDATRIVYRLLEGGYAGVAQVAAAPPPPPPAPVPAPLPSPPSPPLALDADEPMPIPAPMPRPSAPGWQPPPNIDPGKVVAVFNFIFREVRDEVTRRGQLEPFVASANAALKGNAISGSPVLNGLAFQADGSLSAMELLASYERLKHEGQMGSEPLMSLKQALSDVMFFLLFQAGELLESRADEDLARRVKELLATIDLK